MKLLNELMRKILFFLMFLTSVVLVAQEELNAVVSVNSDKIQGSNKQIFKTLETQLTEFVNQTKWTDEKFLPQERINCAFTIIINSRNNNNFEASLQVQSTRPVYGSSYQTPILNINDTNLNFRYNEFDSLIFNPNSFDSNLVSTIVFYIYAIIGFDAETFALNGGEKYFKKAENIVLRAQQSGGEGWQNKVGKQNKFMLINNMISSNFSKLHSIYYRYHRKGLDVFSKKERTAKREILNSLLSLKQIQNIRIGNYMTRIFLDAKSDEIVRIFSSGKTVGKEMELKEILQKIAPTQNNKWRKIKL